MTLNEEIHVGLWDHIEDLRRTLIKIAFIVVFGFIIAFLFHDFIIQLFVPVSSKAHITTQKVEHKRVRNDGPEAIIFSLPDKIVVTGLNKSTHTGSSSYRIESEGYVDYEKESNDSKLVLLSPLEGLTVTLKICFWIALAGTAPLWGAVLMQFISPGLKTTEKRLIIPFLALSLVVALIGSLFAYYITLPMANHYFSLFNKEIGQDMWSLSHYVDYTFILLLGHIVAFELCLLLLCLVHYGWVSAEWMISKRRYMIVIAFIMGAILTPPDVLTQFLMAIPLIGIYEVAILYSKIRRNTA